jgi:predicted neuraminidase
MLMTLVAGDYHYNFRPLTLKLNDIFIYRSHDRGQTWNPPVRAPNVYNQHAWVPLVPKHSFGGKRIYVFYTYPTPGDFNGNENAGIAQRYSEDDGRTWSPPQRIRPVNDPAFQGMWCINATETAAGTWLIAPHESDWTQKPVTSRQYILRSTDQGKTWTCLPGKRPAGWRVPGGRRMDEGRPIWLEGDKVALFERSQEGHIWRSQSDDDGKTWSEFQPTALVHPDAPPMIQKLGDGKRLIALFHNRHHGGGFNHKDRCELWIALSITDLMVCVRSGCRRPTQTTTVYTVLAALRLQKYRYFPRLSAIDCALLQ